MQKLIIILLLSTAFFSCEEEPIETQILGTWELTATYYSIGGPDVLSQPVEDGFSYTFNDDLTFTSTLFENCTYGTYSIKSNELTLLFGCPDFIAGSNNETNKLAFNLTFVSKERFQLTPTFPVRCVEQCGSAFEKVE